MLALGLREVLRALLFQTTKALVDALLILLGEDLSVLNALVLLHTHLDIMSQELVENIVVFDRPF